MRSLVSDDKSKMQLHKQAEKFLQKKLSLKKRCKIPNRRGGEPNPRLRSDNPVVHYSKHGGLFYCPLPQATEGGNRTWDAFGFFDGKSDTQKNVVQINIPFGDNSVRATAGFYARDTKSQEAYLMHTGHFSGAGMKKEEVLEFFSDAVCEVEEPGGKLRKGIVVGAIDENLANRIENFVRQVDIYKEKIRSSVE